MNCVKLNEKSTRDLLSINCFGANTVNYSVKNYNNTYWIMFTNILLYSFRVQCLKKKIKKVITRSED